MGKFSLPTEKQEKQEKEPQKDDGLAPKPLSKCEQCVVSRQRHDARMIVLDRLTICKLLYLEHDDFKYPPTEISKFDSGKFEGKLTEKQPVEINYKESNDCSPLNWKASIRLAGYYIKLEDSNLNATENRLIFYPSWITESSTEIKEEIGQAFIIDKFGISESIHYMGDGEYITLEPNVFNNYVHNHFKHEIFQFHSLAKRNIGILPFMNVFISRHDLLLISNGSTHIGLCGATVQTGNIASFTHDANIQSPAVKIKNQEYFTYRVIGFVEQTIKEGLKGLVKKNMILKEDSNTFVPGIPAETWAVPCPPRWKPIEP